MSDAYERVKAGRLSFKGGGVSSGSKSIHKKRKNHKKTGTTATKNTEYEDGDEEAPPSTAEEVVASAAGDVYTIDAAKKMKYEELFPVETRKFGYDPKLKNKSVEDALDDRVKKKADRYCK